MSPCVQGRVSWTSTSSHVLQVLPQDLLCSAVRDQALERLPAQAEELRPIQPFQLGAQAVEAKLGLAPVQPVVDLPLRPQRRICSGTVRTPDCGSPC